MEHTDAPVERSAGEIMAQLRDAGASQITTHYEGGKVTGIRWVMFLAGSDQIFSLPARTDPIYQILRGRLSGRLDKAKEERLRARADRIAWRQLLRWIEAQMAMIQTGMAQPAEVFLPYRYDPATHQTLFEYVSKNGLKQLTA
jgi:hypothetical protein